MTSHQDGLAALPVHGIVMLTVELSGVSQQAHLSLTSPFVLADVRSNSVLDKLWVFQSPDRPNATPDYACPCALLFTDEPFRLCCLRMRIIDGKPGLSPLAPLPLSV